MNSLFFFYYYYYFSLPSEYLSSFRANVLLIQRIISINNRQAASSSQAIMIYLHNVHFEHPYLDTYHTCKCNSFILINDCNFAPPTPYVVMLPGEQLPASFNKTLISEFLIKIKDFCIMCSHDNVRQEQFISLFFLRFNWYNSWWSICCKRIPALI